MAKNRKKAIRKLTRGQKAVYGVLDKYGKMPDAALVPLTQHVAGIHMSSSGIRSRRAELTEKGFVAGVDTVTMPSGRSAYVWQVV